MGFVNNQRNNAGKMNEIIFCHIEVTQLMLEIIIFRIFLRKIKCVKENLFFNTPFPF